MAKQQQISIESKVTALVEALQAKAPSDGAIKAAKFAPIMAGGVVTVEIKDPAALIAENTADMLDFIKHFRLMAPNNLGVTPEEGYLLASLFWSGNDAARIIATYKGKPSGLLSVVARSARGFKDHLLQVEGVKLDGSEVVKPRSSFPNFPAKVFTAAGKNEALALALIGHTGEYPAAVVKAAPAPSGVNFDTFDPFADLV